MDRGTIRRPAAAGLVAVVAIAVGFVAIGAAAAGLRAAADEYTGKPDS